MHKPTSVPDTRHVHCKQEFCSHGAYDLTAKDKVVLQMKHSVKRENEETHLLKVVREGLSEMRRMEEQAASPRDGMNK